MSWHNSRNKCSYFNPIVLFLAGESCFVLRVFRADQHSNSQFYTAMCSSDNFER